MLETMGTALLPVVILMLLGWLGGRRGHFQRADVAVLATFVTRYALPLSLFLGALRTPPQKLQNLPFVACMLFGFLGTYAIALLVARRVFGHDLKTSTMQALVCTFPDMAYFGAPILAQVCGPEGFIAVLVGNLITSLVILPLTLVLIHWSDGEQAGAGVWRTLRGSLFGTLGNPMVWLPVLGVAMSWNGLALPAPLRESAELLGHAAGGVSLLALGLMFHGERPRLNADVACNVLLKNLLQPLLMWAGIGLFGVEAGFARQALIVGAVPTAIAASMLAVRHGRYAAEASDSVVIGTVLALFGQAALIALIT